MRRNHLLKLKLTDEAMAGALEHLKAHEITHVAMQELFAELGTGVGSEQISVWRDSHDCGIALGTISNLLTRLKREGKTIAVSPGSYVTTDPDSSFTTPDSLGTGNRENGNTSEKRRFQAGDRVSTPRGSGIVEEGKTNQHGKYPVRLDSGGDPVGFPQEELTVCSVA